MSYTHVIWDWNGTLLDDANWCMQIENDMLNARGMKPIASIEWYRDAFCFPIKDYYRKMGHDFSKESFESLSEEYHQLYLAGDEKDCPLQEGTVAVLEAISGAGLRQVILSASEAENLRIQTSRYDILPYFDEILGIDNLLAGSKIEIGIAYSKRAGAERMVLIGDSLHDAEVAAAIGVDCILIANGHQSRERLLEAGVTVVDSIREVLPHVGITAQK